MYTQGSLLSMFDRECKLSSYVTSLPASAIAHVLITEALLALSVCMLNAFADITVT
jgi:hypothetical protein